jgi:hypothetical protein
MAQRAVAAAKTTLTRFILAMKFFAHSHSAVHASRMGRKIFGLPVCERRSVRLSSRLHPTLVGLALLPLTRDEGLSPDTAAQLWPVLTAFP